MVWFYAILTHKYFNLPIQYTLLLYFGGKIQTACMRLKNNLQLTLRRIRLDTLGGTLLDAMHK